MKNLMVVSLVFAFSSAYAMEFQKASVMVSSDGTASSLTINIPDVYTAINLIPANEEVDNYLQTLKNSVNYSCSVKVSRMTANPGPISVGNVFAIKDCTAETLNHS